MATYDTALTSAHLAGHAGWPYRPEAPQPVFYSLATIFALAT